MHITYCLWSHLILNSLTALAGITLAYHPSYSLQSTLSPSVVILFVCFFTAYHLGSSGRKACLTLCYTPLLTQGPRHTVCSKYLPREWWDFGDWPLTVGQARTWPASHDRAPATGWEEKTTRKGTNGPRWGRCWLSSSHYRAKSHHCKMFLWFTATISNLLAPFLWALRFPSLKYHLGRIFSHRLMIDGFCKVFCYFIEERGCLEIHSIGY